MATLYCSPRGYWTFVVMEHCWLLSNLLFTKAPYSLISKQLSSWSVPWMFLVQVDYSFPGTGPGISLYWNLWGSSQLMSLSSLLRSHWMAAQASGVPTTPHNSVESANLLRVCSVPSSRMLLKSLNSISPSSNPLGTLVTAFQPDFMPSGTAF